MRILINIDVEDVEAAARFYVQALGLKVERHLFHGTVIELGGAPSPIYLSQKEAGSLPHPGTASPRTYARHWTPVHLDFAVTGIESAVERAVAAGAKLESGIESFNWGCQATFCDPFGHGFCLLEFSEHGYEAVRSRT